MAYTIKVVAGKMKMVAKPVERRHRRVSVMPADEENAGMEEDQDINQGRELKPAVGQRQDGQGSESGKDLQSPGEVVVRANHRPRQNRDEAGRQRQQVRFLFWPHGQ